MDLSALRLEILLSNKTASEKAEAFLLKSKVNDSSKDEWRNFIAGIPEDVKKEIGMLKSAGQQAGTQQKFTGKEIVLESTWSQMSKPRNFIQLESVDDLLNHLEVDLALRCLRSEPQLHSKGYAKRELISPVLYTASILAGELEVAAEYNARDSDAVGSVDFVILKNQFVISVLEVSGSSCSSS
ncbi:hypothetical protein ABBQ38_005206 [Trebouxia sp. C0009 RCD-2024]